MVYWVICQTKAQNVMAKVARSTSSSDAENPSAQIAGKATARDVYRKESLTNPRFVEVKSGETLAIVGARPQSAEKQRTAAEREIIATLERMKGRKLTEQEISLSLEQGAR